MAFSMESTGNILLELGEISFVSDKLPATARLARFLLDEKRNNTEGDILMARQNRHIKRHQRMRANQLSDHWEFGEFYILPRQQGRGIGSCLLKQAIADAERTGLPIRLAYLKWNSVGTLYRRHGFRQIGENDTHYFMERKPA